MTACAAQEFRSEFVPDIGGVRLQCPRCCSDLDILRCSGCGFEVAPHDGILRLIPPERLHRYARFIADYERIRAAEGRGSASDDYYHALPFKDLSGNNSDQWRIRGRSFDKLLRTILLPRLARGARILDIGAGNCWMSFRLALAGYAPFALDLLTNRNDGLGAAEHYRKLLGNLFPRFQAEMAFLPFADAQFDCIVFNASFHYAEDPVRVLRESLRCVRAGGLIAICDTPWYAHENSGRQMLEERRAAFLRTHGTASDSIQSIEFVTPERLSDLERKLSIRWTAYSPGYGLKWALRPLVAKVHRRREPSRFRIYVTRKPA